MKTRMRRVHWTVLAAGALVLLFLAVFSMWRESDSGTARRELPRIVSPGSGAADTAVSMPSQEETSKEPEDTRGADVGVAVDVAELGAIRAEAASIGTAADLARKGYPVISNPRSAELQRVAERTIEETIADLGHVMSMIFSSVQSGHEDAFGWTLAAYGGLPHQINVLRVIEEGRAEPTRVSALLRKELQVATAQYWRNDLQMWESAYPQKFTPTGRATGSSEIPKPPAKDYGRAGYAILYCLANIGELQPSGVLAGWLERPGAPADPGQRDIWLIDQYFRQASVSDTPAAMRHAELCAGLELDGGSIKQSRWNAMWSVNDIMVKMKDVDVSEIPTIEVLKTPDGVNLTDTQRWGIHQNFMEHTRASR